MVKRTPSSWTMAALLMAAVVPSQASVTPFYDDIDTVLPNRVVDYGNRHPFDRNLQTVDEAGEAHQSLVYDANSVHEPIRIHFLTDLLEARRGESFDMDLKIDYILETALPEAATRWAQHLSVVPVQGSGIDVRPDTCYGAFGDFVPSQTVVDADLVVIVGGVDVFLQNGEEYAVCEERTLAVGSACELDQYDRPIVGFINFCLGFEAPDAGLRNYIQRAYSQWMRVSLSQDLTEPDPTDVTVHELAHVLAFSSWLFKYFRDDEGNPRTPRPFTNQEVMCADGKTAMARFPASSTLAGIAAPDGSMEYSITTPRVRQVAQNHLNCPNLEGARLEDQGACIGSHWHERLFFGEIMGPALSMSGENYLSPLSLALLEDSGWYKVDYRGAETPTFGLGAGCDFVHNNCIQDDVVPSWGRGMFCDSAMRFDGGAIATESLDTVLCDPSHKSWTICDLWDQQTVPTGLTEFPESSVRYFTNANFVTSFPLAEFCPIPAKTIGFDCTVEDETYEPFYRGETVGPSSRCINAYREGESGRKVRRPGCMEVSCDAQERIVVISQGMNQLRCEFDGQVLPSPSSASAFIECPRFAAVCPDLVSCPASCSGRGVCSYDGSPTCQCFDGDLSSDGCYPVEQSVPSNAGSSSQTSSTTETPNTPTDSVFPGSDAPTPSTPQGGLPSVNGNDQDGLVWVPLTNRTQPPSPMPDDIADQSAAIGACTLTLLLTSSLPLTLLHLF